MSNIWRTPKEAFNPQCTWPAVKHSKESADGMAGHNVGVVWSNDRSVWSYNGRGIWGHFTGPNASRFAMMFPIWNKLGIPLKNIGSKYGWTFIGHYSEVDFDLLQPSKKRLCYFDHALYVLPKATDNIDCNIDQKKFYTDSKVEFNTSGHALLKIKVLRGGFCKLYQPNPFDLKYLIEVPLRFSFNISII